MPFDRGAAEASQALEKHVPRAVSSILDERFEPADPGARLDVFHPAEVEGIDRMLTTIVWMHGAAGYRPPEAGSPTTPRCWRTPAAPSWARTTRSLPRRLARRRCRTNTSSTWIRKQDEWRWNARSGFCRVSSGNSEAPSRTSPNDGGGRGACVLRGRNGGAPSSGARRRAGMGATMKLTASGARPCRDAGRWHPSGTREIGPTARNATLRTFDAPGNGDGVVIRTSRRAR